MGGRKYSVPSDHSDSVKELPTTPPEKHLGLAAKKMTSQVIRPTAWRVSSSIVQDVASNTAEQFTSSTIQQVTSLTAQQCNETNDEIFLIKRAGKVVQYSYKLGFFDRFNVSFNVSLDENVIYMRDLRLQIWIYHEGFFLFV